MWWAEAAVPCPILVLVWGQQCPARSGRMGKTNPCREEGLIWGFKVVFRCLLASAATALQNRVVFHWTPPNFQELKKKICTLTPEAFPTFAFVRGTRGCGQCFLASPWRNETPHPCSASLAGCFPALSFPWENQPQHLDLPGALLGVRGGVSGACPQGSPSPTGSPCRQLWLRIP